MFRLIGGTTTDTTTLETSAMVCFAGKLTGESNPFLFQAYLFFTMTINSMLQLWNGLHMTELLEDIILV